MGVPKDAWYGAPDLWRNGLHPDDRERVLAAHAEVIARGETLDIEYRWIKPSGEVVWIEDRARVERTFDGKPLRMRGTNADITARKRLERQREALLRIAGWFATDADTEARLRATLDEAVALVGAQAGTVRRPDAGHTTLIAVAGTRSAADFPREIAFGQGAGGRAAVERRTVIVNDYQSNSQQGQPAPPWVNAALAAPLLHEGRLLGVLTVVSGEPTKCFSRVDAEALELLAGFVSAALAGEERARLETVTLAGRELSHRLNNHLALALGTTEIVAGEPTLQPQLRQLLHQAVEALAAAARDIERFQNLGRFETKETPVGRALDLDASSE
jgi:hypothetical protein